jgi:hypothetical protein
LVTKPEERGPLGRLRLRWEEGSKMDTIEVGWELRIGTGGGLL